MAVSGLALAAARTSASSASGPSRCAGAELAGSYGKLDMTSRASAYDAEGKLDQGLAADYGVDCGLRLVFQNGFASACDQHAAAQAGSCLWAQAVAQASRASGPSDLT